MKNIPTFEAFVNENYEAINEGVDLKKIDLNLDDKDREIDLDLGFGA